MDNKLEQFLNNDNCYFIHYGSDGFYNGSSPAPKVSCIVIYNNKNNDKIRFCPSDYLKGNNSTEQAETLCIEKFKQLLINNPDICFIHWNMQADGFGFKAISARAKELGVELPTVNSARLFDLSSYVAYLSGKRLTIKQVLWFNSLLDNEFLDGKTEAEYSNLGKYEEIYESINLKVVGLSMLVGEIKNGTLKTEKPFAEPNDGLTKEERREQALKIAAVREQMLKDIVNHNKRMHRIREDAYEQQLMEQEESTGLFFFDFVHPVLSMVLNWFGNKK